MYRTYRRHFPKFVFDAMQHFWSTEDRAERIHLRESFGPQVSRSITVDTGPFPIEFTMCFDLDEGHDLGMFQQAFNHQQYEPEVTHWIVTHLDPGDVFVDVGCNNGYYSVLASKVVGRTGKVLAFDPNPKAFSRMTRNRDTNAAVNITAHCMALSDQTAMATLYVDETEDGLSTLTSREHVSRRGGAAVVIPMDRLDNLLGGAVPRVVKVDVEGHELRVLRGMERLLDSPECPCLIVEWNPEYATEELLDYLGRRFEIYQSPDGSAEGALTSVTDVRQLPVRRICNLLCVPKGWQGTSN